MSAGLDARAAAIVMRTVRNIVSSARAAIVPIDLQHQATFV